MHVIFESVLMRLTRNYQ